MIKGVFSNLGMKSNNDDHKQKQQHGRTNGSFRALSGYLRVVSSGASSVASTIRSAASAASAIVDRDCDSSHDQVYWAGFDNLECEGGVTRRVLLLGYRSGFQVWDVEEADNVRDLVSKHDGPVSFMQMLPKPLTSHPSGDNFANERPLLVICTGGYPSGDSNGVPANSQDTCSGNFVPTTVRFYSLRSQSYVHMLKFRSAVYSVRCSSRVVAISQTTQIHCFDTSTLEREYTIITNPVVSNPGCGGVGSGPLAVGSRWLAYSGSPVAVSNCGRVSPQHLTPSASFPLNGSLVAHYAKESSKQLATGIVTLGDIGYKKLSRYCSEHLPDSNNSSYSGSTGWKSNGAVNGHLTDADHVGMVIVRDIVSKSVISQFRVHRSPIASLCFDPSGTLLVTASIQGHNINVFQIKQGVGESSSKSDAHLSYAYLYRLQRGLTNAVIQDISFSVDSQWIMISSSRGTSHLFAIPPLCLSMDSHYDDAKGTAVNNGLDKYGDQMAMQLNVGASGSPLTISAISRIKNGNNGWRGAVSGAAAAATGKPSSVSGAIASSFQTCKGSSLNHRLLIFSPSGCMIQYALRRFTGVDPTNVLPKLGIEPTQENDAKLVVEAIQKWNICHKQSRRDREENTDIYGENGISDGNRMYREGNKKGNSVYPEDIGTYSNGKTSPEDKFHLYISEAELQMYEAEAPVWVRPQIYFQSMMTDGIKTDEEYNLGGEIEIEKISSRMIEARSKSLVPVFDYIQTSKVPQTRIRAGLPPSYSRVEGSRREGRQTPTETTKRCVNNNYNREDVNNRETIENETQQKFVNNHVEDRKMKDKFEDEVDEFD